MRSNIWLWTCSKGSRVLKTVNTHIGNHVFFSGFEGPGTLGTGPQPNVAPRAPFLSPFPWILTSSGQLFYTFFETFFCRNIPSGFLGAPGGIPLASLCSMWDPHLYARLGLPRRPEDYRTRGPEDHNTGPEDLSIRLSTET